MSDQRALLAQLDGKPDWKIALPLGLQHILAMFISNLTPILLVALAAGQGAELGYLYQMAMFASAVATFVQLYPVGGVGARLPIVMGTSFSFVGIGITVAVQYGLPAVFTAALIGSVVEIGLGYALKVMSEESIRKYFPPVVNGTVVLAIGLGLLATGAAYFGGNGNTAFGDWASPSNLFLGAITLITFVGLNAFGKGFWKTSAIFVAVMVGFAISIVGTLMGAFPEGSLAIVQFSKFTDAPWFSIPQPFKYGFDLRWDAVALFAAMYVITAIETIGDANGVAMGGLDRNGTRDEISGSILADGYGSAFAAIFNALPNTSFSQNVGIIAITKVVNRWVVALGTFVLLGASLIPKVGAIFNMMPLAVIGGILIMIFAMISVSGIRIITEQDLSGRNGAILAIALGVGFGIASQGAFAAAFDANEAAASGLMAQVWRFLGWFFSDKVAAAGLMAFIMNLIYPADEK